MSWKAIDRTGLVYGGLTVLKLDSIRSIGKEKRRYFWLCQCHCGKKTTVLSSNLSKNPIGCGCTLPGKRKPEAFFNRLRESVIHSGQIRGFQMTLSETELMTLFTGNCHYCGAIPQLRPGYKKRAASGHFPSNGIDRVNNGVGYVSGNCVSCCRTCNEMKMAMSIDEFKSQIALLYKWAFGSKE